MPDWRTGRYTLQYVRAGDAPNIMAHASLIASGSVVMLGEDQSPAAYVAAAKASEKAGSDYQAEIDRLWQEKLDAKRQAFEQAEQKRRADFEAGLARFRR